MKEIKFIDILRVPDSLKEKVRRWRNKKGIRELMLTQHVISKAEHAKWLEDLRHRKDRKFWVVFVGNTPIGAINLQNINYRESSSGWGFYIGEDNYRGKGFGKRILFKLLKLFFDEMEFKMLLTKVLSKNTIALNLYDKFKFREIDRLPFKNREKVVLLAFSRKDWIKSKKDLKWKK